MDRISRALTSNRPRLVRRKASRRATINRLLRTKTIAFFPSIALLVNVCYGVFLSIFRQ